MCGVDAAEGGTGHVPLSRTGPGPDAGVTNSSATAPATSVAAQSLLARLDDPATARALHSLLDNAELLAMLATMTDGVLRRGEVLTGNLADGLAELRTAAASAGVRMPDGTSGLAALGPLAADVLPGLRALAASDLVRPGTVSALDTMAGAVAEGLAPQAAAQRRPGLRGLAARLRDRDVARGLDTLLDVAAALGRRRAGTAG